MWGLRLCSTGGSAGRREGESGDESGEHRELVQSMEPDAALRHPQDELAEKLAAHRSFLVGPAVVVPLEGVAAVCRRDDAVQDHRVELSAAVRHDVVPIHGPHNGEVPSVEARRHADAVGGDEGAGAPEGRWYYPGRDNQDREREQRAQDANDAQGDSSKGATRSAPGCAPRVAQISSRRSTARSRWRAR